MSFSSVSGRTVVPKLHTVVDGHVLINLGAHPFYMPALTISIPDEPGTYYQEHGGRGIYIIYDGNSVSVSPYSEKGAPPQMENLTLRDHRTLLESCLSSAS